MASLPTEGNRSNKNTQTTVSLKPKTLKTFPSVFYGIMTKKSSKLKVKHTKKNTVFDKPQRKTVRLKKLNLLFRVTFKL